MASWHLAESRRRRGPRGRCAGPRKASWDLEGPRVASYGLAALVGPGRASWGFRVASRAPRAPRGASRRVAEPCKGPCGQRALQTEDGRESARTWVRCSGASRGTSLCLLAACSALLAGQDHADQPDPRVLRQRDDRAEQQLLAIRQVAADNRQRQLRDPGWKARAQVRRASVLATVGIPLGVSSGILEVARGSLGGRVESRIGI